MAEAIAQHWRSDMILIATSDYSHAGPGYKDMPPEDSGLSTAQYATQQDARVIKAMVTEATVEALQASSRASKGQNRCSMCGLNPLLVTMLLRERLSWPRPKLLSYATSDAVMHRGPNMTGFASLWI